MILSIRRDVSLYFQKIMTCFSDHCNDNLYFDILIGYCLNLRRNFVTSSFVYVRRTVNTVVHDLVTLSHTSYVIFSYKLFRYVYSSIISPVVQDIQT